MARSRTWDPPPPGKPALNTLQRAARAPAEDFDTDRLQGIVDESLGGERKLTVDDGGGLHDGTGRRVGAIRRTDSGEWITERQNPLVDRR